MANRIPQELILKLKPYIQPFEKVLANAELSGLVEPNLIKKPFSEKAKNKLSIMTSVSPEHLINRLAYWESVGKNELDGLSLTKQVLYELTQNGIKNNKPNSIHKQRRLRYGPHDIHEYRGKFFPQLVKSLINASKISKGGIILDPMSGSGTASCESRSMSMHAVGLDINPLSVKIARTKCEILEVDSIALKNEANILIEKTFNLDPELDVSFERQWVGEDVKYLTKWFDIKALSEVYQILEIIQKQTNKHIQSLFELCLSNILRPVSWQKDSDLRVRKEVTIYSKGEVRQQFIEEVRKQISKLIPYLTILQKDVQLLSFDVRVGDTKNINKTLKEWNGKCDMLITSPPYATALPYLDTDRLSLIVLGLLPRKDHRKHEFQLIGNREVTENQRKELWTVYQNRKKELPQTVCSLINKLAKIYHTDRVGFRRRNLPALLSKYFLDMNDSMLSVTEMMKPGSNMFYVVGNNSTKVNGSRVEIETDKLLWAIGKKIGWKQEKALSMELLPSRDIFRENRGSAETILYFRLS